MRRILRRLGLGLIITTCLGLLALDIYTDWRPEVLVRFKTEHPALFPANPWLTYGIGAATTIGIVLFGWWQHRRRSRRNRRTNEY